MKKLSTLFLFIFISSGSLFATTYYLRTTANNPTILAQWTTDPTGLTAAGTPGSFAGTHTWNIRNVGSISLTASWTVASTSTVVIGNGASAITLTVSGGGKIGSASGPPIIINNLATYYSNNGTQPAGTKTTFNVGSTFVYGPSMGFYLSSDVFYNLTIEDASFPYLNGDVTVGNIFTNNATTNNFDLAGWTFTLNGSTAGSGLLIDSYANLVLGGSTNISLNFFVLPSTPVNLNTVTINLTLSAKYTLNNNLTVTDLNLSAGSIDLNGKLLTITNNLTATSGSLTGSATSSLTINGFGVISGTLNGLTSLSGLTLNDAGQTLNLGSNLAISDSLNLTNGSLDITGKLLTLSGPAIFGAGFLTGSTTSSLTIDGAGTISGSLNMTQTSAATRSLYDLTLNRAGEILTIANPLEIINSITPTLGTIASGGNITLIANATRSARIGIVGGAITGNITAQTYAASSGVTGWTNLASSGITGLTVASWYGQFPITCNGCATSTTSAGGAFASMQGGDETGTGGTEYVTVSNTTALTPGTGFWVYLGTGLSTTTPITITETGSAVQGTLPIALTKTPAGQNGYNLIANAYTSPISWPACASTNSALTDGSAYLYSPVGGQISLNGAGVSTPGGYCTGGVIAMGQGFYVNATSAGTFNFLESHKSAANTSANPLLKTNATNTNAEFRLGITDPYGAYDETVIIADNNATSNFDNMLDAYKMFQTPGYSGTGPVYSQYTTINSLSNNKDYAINSLPLSSTQNLVIPIRAKAMVSGTYTINPLQIQNLPTTSCVTLKDNLLNINHDLRSGSYVCTIADTTSAPRFELTICAGSIATNVSQVKNTINNVIIGQDGTSGVFVKTSFDKNTKSVISAYNVMGQKIIADKEIEGTENLIHLDFNETHNQIIIIKVSNDKGQTAKKVFVN